MKATLKISDSWSPLVMRVVLGVVVFAHGAQKLFGWFGGYGFEGTMMYFTSSVGLPWIVGLLVILLESIGALLLIAGIFTRFISASFTLLAVGIVFSAHIQHGFFMNWGGTQGGEGIEFFLLWIALSTSLAISGAGRYSVDAMFPTPLQTSSGSKATSAVSKIEL